MSEPATNPSSPPPAAQPSPGSETEVKLPRFSLLILFALVSIVFTARWLGLYEFLHKAIWSNGFVTGGYPHLRKE